jgi:hypothetical protein
MGQDRQSRRDILQRSDCGTVSLMIARRDASRDRSGTRRARRACGRPWDLEHDRAFLAMVQPFALAVKRRAIAADRPAQRYIWAALRYLYLHPTLEATLRDRLLKAWRGSMR